MFSSRATGAAIFYDLKSDIDTPLAQALSEAIQADPRLNDVRAVVLDMADHRSIDHRALAILSPLGLNLRRMDKVIYLTNAPRPLRTFIEQQGMSLILRIPDASTLRELMSGTAAKADKALDVEFMNPFLEGTMEVLKIQCSTVCKPLQPVVKSNFQATGPVDIAGLIGIKSDRFRGSIALCFPEKIFLTLMSRMLSEEYKEINSETEDGAGELLNMIFGHAKTILNAKGYSLERALPNVVRGKDLILTHLPSARAIVLPFETDVGLFHVELGREGA